MHCGNCRSRDMHAGLDFHWCSECGAKTYVDGTVVLNKAPGVTTTEDLHVA